MRKFLGLAFCLIFIGNVHAEEVKSGQNPSSGVDVQSFFDKMERISKNSPEAIDQFTQGSSYLLPGIENYARAAPHFKQAADLGMSDAQNVLGDMYSKGQGVSQDYTEAARLYKLAAEQGLAAAQNKLGDMYSKGQGVSQDYTEAARFYKLAAEQGDTNSQLSLSMAYVKGQGVMQSFTLAYMLVNLVAINPKLVAADKETILKFGDNMVTAAKISPEQVTKIQKSAIACQANHFKNCGF